MLLRKYRTKLTTLSAFFNGSTVEIFSRQLHAKNSRCRGLVVLRPTRRPAAVCLTFFYPFHLYACFYYFRFVLINFVEFLWIF